MRLRSKGKTSVPQPLMLWDKRDDSIRELDTSTATTTGFSPADQSLQERVLQIVWVSYIPWLKSRYFPQQREQGTLGSVFHIAKQEVQKINLFREWI